MWIFQLVWDIPPKCLIDDSFQLGLIVNPEEGGKIFLRKMLICNGLYSVTSLKTEQCQGQLLFPDLPCD
jgi:hypothetical protein